MSIVLILGAGANVGKSVAQKFASKGFKVAIASRTLTPEIQKLADISIEADFSNPATIKPLFDKVKSEIGTPSVVIYNAYGSTPIQTNILSLPVSTFETELSVNTTSVYAAAQEAVAGFKALPVSVPKSFIFTGNCLNILPMPALFSMGVGKSATAHLIQAASMSYENEGYTFYYADERKADGAPIAYAISGEAAGEFYYDISQKREQGLWEATFVQGTGYVKFQE